MNISMFKTTPFDRDYLVYIIYIIGNTITPKYGIFN